jgi:hypothetical protein
MRFPVVRPGSRAGFVLPSLFSILLVLLLGMVGGMFLGCGGVTKPDPLPVRPPSAPQSSTYSAPADPLAAWDAKILEAQAAEAEAAKKGDRLALLEAQKAETEARLNRSDAEKEILKIGLKQTKKQIEDEKLALQQTKLYWFAFILGLVGLGGAALAIFSAPARRLGASIAAGSWALAGVVIFFAKYVLPWLPYIGAVLGVVVIAAGIWYLRNKDKAVALRDRAAEQIATGINAAKDAIPEFGAGYRKILGDHMDADVDVFYDKVRAKLSGVLPGGKSDQGKG